MSPNSQHQWKFGGANKLQSQKQCIKCGRVELDAQPAPVVPDGLRLALSNAGIAAPESDEMLAATQEKYIQMLVTWVKDRKPFQPEPVVPEKATVGEMPFLGSSEGAYVRGWNDCRAAMLSNEPQNVQQNIPENIPSIKDTLQALRNIGPIDAEKIQAERDELNSPVIPEGYVLVPKEPTKAMILSAMRDNETGEVAEIYDLMLTAAQKEMKGE